MGRTLTLDNRANEFTQGLGSNNVEINLFTLGGRDTIILNRVDGLGGGNTVNAGAGNDTVVNLLESGNIIRLGAGNDTYVGRGFGSFASDRGDRVFAGAGNDKIAVETFKSEYSGQAGNDQFFSVGWQNTFRGGAGTDSISYAPRDDDSVQSRSGVSINLGAGFADTGANRREFLFSIENATGSGADDILIGSAKANRLNGAGGFDVLTGKGGADRFVFSKITDCAVSDDGIDIITDFSHAARDRIGLGSIDANVSAGAAGNQAFRFIGSAEFTGAAGQLRLELFNEGTVVSGDVNGDGLADFRFLVANVSSLVAGDFLL